MGIPDSYGIKIGENLSGEKNLITDVPGVKVGHCTLIGENINTGVTALLPHGGNCFQEKTVASCHVINGFGKSAGLLQIEELGTIETPILLTNTFSVGTASTALIRYMLERNEDIGISTGTVNPLVFECNDGRLNDIRALRVTENDVLTALMNCGGSFEEGAVGAGRGMCCYGLKGGIGSASRRITVDHSEYTVGALLLTNFGQLKDLTINGRKLGQKLSSNCIPSDDRDQGSVIAILATDLPLSCRQLKRVAHRAQNGLARTGTITGNGSGEIVLAFSTANHVSHFEKANPLIPFTMLHEEEMDKVFRASIECVEESVISSLFHAENVCGMGNTYESLLNRMGSHSLDLSTLL